MSKIKTSFNVVEEKSAHLAVLIDADNASAQTIKAILEETTKFGEATVKRIYGNFVGDSGKWKAVINEYAIKPMQQFAYTKGKNATDGFMIIDAMDLLYTNRFDGFCIVSSDSDFTALAIRLKEQGVTVYGFGKKQTPEAFLNACSQFIYVENLLPELNDDKQVDITLPNASNTQKKVQQTENSTPTVSIDNQKIQSTELPIETIRKVFEQFDSEWVAMTAFGSTWKRLQVDIDPRSYGCKKFTDLVKKYPDVFDYKMETDSDTTQEHMYVKLKI
ncbi:NYN domain-containing protein [[Mannheimia] succiniciproducens]|uniref:HTH OST-type domain-containing protein n=1 Tax=Mannheimia succiniciproducens (strain KCTC 0769BP / MBEL55E) TaxID=221988 RepID=Q65TX0_MANSM|nr:NYN domain-containing protein [[Mannheimia] succiniciproducens]AAU37590.1 unknown [[Mannheimia] succiniciproducens MBEL55E]